VVEEPGVVERRGVPRLGAVLVAQDAREDQVGEDRLLLLPPRLPVVPGEAVPVLALALLGLVSAGFYVIRWVNRSRKRKSTKS